MLFCKSAQFVMEQDPDLVVVEAVFVKLHPLIVSHLVVVHDSVVCPEDVVQDTAQEDTVVVVQSLDFWDIGESSGLPGPGESSGLSGSGESSGLSGLGESSGLSDSGLDPGVGLLPGPMVIVGHGTLGTGGGTGGG